MQAKEFRRTARENLRGNWGVSIGAAVIACLFGSLLVGSTFIPEIEIRIDDQNISNYSDLINILLSGYNLLLGLTAALSMAKLVLGGVVQLGYAKFLLNQHDRCLPRISDLFSQFDNFGKGFCQSFLRGLYVFLWSLLLVIPGIIAAYRYAMTPFILADHPDMTVREAIAASKRMMHGHKWDLFWLDLTFIGWYLLCALTFNLGCIALNPYMNAAYAAFYRHLTSLPPYSMQ